MDPVSHFVDMSVGWSVYPHKRQNSNNAATGSVSGLAINDSIINENKDTNESYMTQIKHNFTLYLTLSTRRGVDPGC